MKKPVGVTKNILEKFLSVAKDTDVSEDVVEALRQSLIEDGKCTEKALLAAILPDSGS